MIESLETLDLRRLTSLQHLPLHEIIQSQRTVTSMLVNNRCRVDESSILRNGQVLHELITFLHI